MGPWITGGILVLLFLVIAAGNAQWFWQGIVKKEKTGSSVPLVGGVLGWLGMLQLPVPGVHSLAWLPFVLDAGSLLWVLLLGKLFLERRGGTS